MPKYIKKPVVVDAFTIQTTTDLGELGILVSGDVVIRLADDSLHTMDGTTFASKYTQTSDTAALTGDDWD